MGCKIHTDLDEVLKWVRGLPVNPITKLPEIQGAPSPKNGGNGGGKPRDSDWNDVKPDLSDIPRNTSWLLRRKGDSKAEMRVCFPLGAQSVEIVRIAHMGPDELMRERLSVLTEREALVAIRMDFLREQTDIVLDSARAAGEAVRASRDVQNEGREMTVERAKYIEDLADLRDELSESKKESEWLRQVGYVSAKTMDAITLWRLGKKKNPDGSMLIPDEFKDKIREFLEFHRRDMARPRVSAERKSKQQAIFERLFGLEDGEVDELLDVLKREAQPEDGSDGEDESD